MVHNGIEYADMQVIGEAYDILRRGLGMDAEEIGDVFAEWNKGDLDSYLIEITAEILHHKDAETGKPFVDVVVDHAGMKGLVWNVVLLWLPSVKPCSLVHCLRTVSCVKTLRKKVWLARIRPSIWAEKTRPRSSRTCARPCSLPRSWPMLRA